MFNRTAMPLVAGPFYTNAIMGQGPSAAEREHVRKASSTILREDSIRVEESEKLSPADSWSMHFDCTNQAPYCAAGKENLRPRSDVRLPAKDTPLREMAKFLRESGPTPPHRRPSKLENPSKALAGRRKAMQFLKIKQQSSHVLFGPDQEQYVIFNVSQGPTLTVKELVQSFETKVVYLHRYQYLKGMSRKSLPLVGTDRHIS